MVVYLARDIPAFVMYCINGESRSSLLIESLESTDSICDLLRENQPYAKKKFFFFIGISHYLYRIYNRCKFEMDILFFYYFLCRFPSSNHCETDELYLAT